jgi:hypothetical protein
MQPVVLKLQGDLGDPESVVITEGDLIEYTLQMGTRGVVDPTPRWIQEQLLRRPTLAVGLPLGVYANRLFLHAVFGRGNHPPLFALEPFPDPRVTRIVEQEFGGKLATEDVWSFVPRLYQAVTGRPFDDRLA